MEDSSNTFIQTLRDKLSGRIEDTPTDTVGYTVEEHDFDELDDRTQTTVNKMFDTMRIRSDDLKNARILEQNEKAFRTIRTRTLVQ